MDKRGFTLIELLAVVVVLVIILSIAVPGISGVIKSSKKSAFKSDAKMVLHAIEYRKLKNDDFNPLEVTKENMEAVLGISNDNYSQIVLSLDKELSITLVGLGKWDGLVACGTLKKIDVTESIDDCGMDVIPPVITLNGSEETTAFTNSVYDDAGARAIDNLEGDITNKIVVSNNVDTSKVGTYTVTYTVSDVFGNTSTKSRTVNVVDSTYVFDYVGTEQTFVVPATASYVIESWGAQGGNNLVSRGGLGGYSKGTLKLNKGDVLSINVGGQNGYNGGGSGGTGSGCENGAVGGGSTDVRLNGSTLFDRIIVAGGGGGASGCGSARYDEMRNGYDGGAGGGGNGLIVEST